MKGVAQRLLLLIGEGQQERLIGRSALDGTGDGEVTRQRRLAGVGIAEVSQRNEALQGIHVGHALRRCALRRERRNGDETDCADAFEDSHGPTCVHLYPRRLKYLKSGPAKQDEARSLSTIQCPLIVKRRDRRHP
jgi:hypothetical protein